MKSKTIKKVLISKMEDWLNTIENKDLRKDVRENLLVTGGCIASMYLQEPVNDYDVYIKDMDVLSRLAQYYCEGNVLDGRLRETYINSNPIWKMVHENGGLFGETNEKYVAEDFVRINNLKNNQIKLNVDGAGERVFYEKDIQRCIDEDTIKYKPVFLSQNAISLSHDLQIVLRFSGTSEEIHKTFDYIHATNYFTFDEGLILSKRALESLLTKTLVYQGSLYPLTSIIRMKKFLKRGFTISAGEMLKIMFQISDLNLNDIEVLEEQLIGVDVAYFADLIEVLRSTNPKEITPSFLNKTIDEVFDKMDL